MSNANVTKLTKEELLAERQATPAPVGEQQVSKRADLYSTEYIKKLSLDEIEKFFEPFDVQACAKIPNEQDPKFVYVTCAGFNVVFSDYSFVFDFNGGLLRPDESAKPKFDMAAFADYCMSLDLTPDQVIAEEMTVKLFGQRFPSYTEKRKKVKMEQNRLAFQALPKAMQKTLSIANEQNENTINATHNKLYYGDYAGNPYLMGSNENTNQQ